MKRKFAFFVSVIFLTVGCFIGMVSTAEGAEDAETFVSPWAQFNAERDAFAGGLTDEMKAEGWYAIFDGETLDGWKCNEPYDGFKVEEGCIVGFGERNHLYYVGEQFTDFAFQMEVKVNSGGNSGVYVKSQWEEKKFPTTGFELQVNATHPNPLKTGTLYDSLKYFSAPHGDDEWFLYEATCKNNTIEVKVNGKVLYLYIDRLPPLAEGTEITADNKRIAQPGYLVLQQHDPKGRPMFRNIFVRKIVD